MHKILCGNNLLIYQNFAWKFYKNHPYCRQILITFCVAWIFCLKLPHNFPEFAMFLKKFVYIHGCNMQVLPAMLTRTVIHLVSSTCLPYKWPFPCFPGKSFPERSLYHCHTDSSWSSISNSFEDGVDFCEDIKFSNTIFSSLKLRLWQQGFPCFRAIVGYLWNHSLEVVKNKYLP